jgi:hypothetical protein
MPALHVQVRSVISLSRNLPSNDRERSMYLSKLGLKLHVRRPDVGIPMVSEHVRTRARAAV